MIVTFIERRTQLPSIFLRCWPEEIKYLLYHLIYRGRVKKQLVVSKRQAKYLASAYDYSIFARFQFIEHAGCDDNGNHGSSSVVKSVLRGTHNANIVYAIRLVESEVIAIVCITTTIIIVLIIW